MKPSMENGNTAYKTWMGFACWPHNTPATSVLRYGEQPSHRFAVTQMPLFQPLRSVKTVISGGQFNRNGIPKVPMPRFT